MTDYIREYYQDIREGSIVVGKWILLLYEYIVKGLENRLFYFAPKKANRAVKFIENYCHHSKGRNDLLKLELWQKALVSVIFGILDENNFRQFREVILVVARKNGKSLFAAAIAEYMSFLDDEYGAEVYCLAPKLEQADIIYSCFWQMCQQEEEIKSRIKSRKSDYYIESTNTSIKKIAFNAKKSDGFNPHLVVCDEIASWVGDAGKKQYEVMKSALGARRQPLILSCTTSGYVNEGIYDELILRGTRFLLGDSKEKRLLPVFYMIDDVEKWNDINELAKSNPNLGVSVSVDYMLEEIAIAEGSLSKRSEFMTKYCCIKQNSSQAWLPIKAVEKASGKHFDMEDFRSNYCVAGIDLSQTTDLTSACLVIEKDEELFVISHFWLPAEKLSDAIAKDGIPYQEMIEKGILTLAGENFVDYHSVFDWLVRAVQEYELLPLVVGYDRYSSQYLIQDLNGFGFKTDDVYQGHNLTPVIYECEGLLKDGKVHIGDNALLKIHLLDSAIESDSRTQKVRLKKLAQRSHIDGTAALLDALCVRQKWYSEFGDRLKNVA
ncbi:MAG: terminase large subunit [Clostridiales bacterium]|nr:terminase large subunit [Clostridiales bacterium]MBQ1575013.1 terminase large subunit [Clostridiales bacterium]